MPTQSLTVFQLCFRNPTCCSNVGVSPIQLLTVVQPSFLSLTLLSMCKPSFVSLFHQLRVLPHCSGTLSFILTSKLSFLPFTVSRCLFVLVDQDLILDSVLDKSAFAPCLNVLNCLLILPKLRPTCLSASPQFNAIPVAATPKPVTISDIPIGINPTQHNNTPIATIDTPIIAPRSFRNLAITDPVAPQFNATLYAIAATPAAIKPIPIGKLPTIHSITPNCSNANPITTPKSWKN